MNSSEILEKYNLDASQTEKTEAEMRRILATLIVEAPAKNTKTVAKDNDLEYQRLLSYKKKLRDMSKEERSKLELVLLLESNLG